MSNPGRSLISALNRGDYSAVDEYTPLSQEDLAIVNHHVSELFDRAIRMENFKLFRALLKIPGIRISGDNYCALRHATQVGLVEYVSDIVRIDGVQPNLKDDKGHTALYFAVTGKWSAQKAKDLVRAILLVGDVNTNTRFESGKTVLHIAMEKEWYEVADMLLERGAHPKTEDKNGQTPLFMAMQANNMPFEVFQKMLEFEGDAPEEEEEEETPAQMMVIQDEPANIAEPFVQQAAEDQPATHEDDLNQDADFPDEIQPETHTAPSVDVAGMGDIMDGQGLDDTLDKSFLFTPSNNDPRFRMHRKSVMEKLEDIIRILENNAQALNESDCSRVDPATGRNMFHAAALAGKLGMLVEYLNSKNISVNPSAFKQPDKEGNSIGRLLSASSLLEENLDENVWLHQPALLAEVLSQLPSGVRMRFDNLIIKGNLLLLHTH